MLVSSAKSMAAISDHPYFDERTQLVSVILPIYNSEPYLELALLTVENQTHQNLEIICVNDGSTDESLETIQRHAEADDRYVIINKPNEGYGASCNRGIAAAHGQWIAIVEPDDWIEPTMYEAMLRFAASFDTPIDIIKTPYLRHINPDTANEKVFPCRYKGRIKPTCQPFTLEQAPHLISHHPSIWSALYCSQFLRENAIEFLPLPGAGWSDTPFLMETMGAASSIVYLDQPFYHYREETAEQYDAVARDHPLLPLERWLDMDQSFKRLGLTDLDLLRAHYANGFAYIRRIGAQHELDDASLTPTLKQVLDAMEDEIVLAMEELSAADRLWYASVKGLPTPRINRRSHDIYLAKEALETLTHQGLSPLIHTIRHMS